MSKSSERFKDLEQRISWLERDMEELKKRPVAGRFPSRLLQVVKWLQLRGGGEIARIYADGEKHGFNRALVRKAKRHLEWVRVGHRWAVPGSEESKDNDRCLTWLNTRNSGRIDHILEAGEERGFTRPMIYAALNRGGWKRNGAHWEKP